MHLRTLSAALATALVAATTTATGPAPTAQAAPRTDPGTVLIQTPAAVPIVAGCHERWLARVTFAVPEGGGYDVTLGGWDADGYSFNGSASARALAAGRHAVDLTSQLCGYRRTPGRATLKLFVTVSSADEPVHQQGTFTASTYLKNLTRVGLDKVRGTKARGAKVRLTGRRALRGQFPDSTHTAALRGARVGIYHRRPGGAWRLVTTTRTDRAGAWQARVRPKRTGEWQARYAGSATLMPSSSPVRRIRVR